MTGGGKRGSARSCGRAGSGSLTGGRIGSSRHVAARCGSIIRPGGAAQGERRAAHRTSGVCEGRHSFGTAGGESGAKELRTQGQSRSGTAMAVACERGTERQWLEEHSESARRRARKAVLHSRSLIKSLLRKE